MYRCLKKYGSYVMFWFLNRTKMNEPCRSFVNKASCEFCVYHIQREYKKTSSKRAEIQSSFTRVDPKRLQQKVLGKDQVSGWISLSFLISAIFLFNLYLEKCEDAKITWAEYLSCKC